MKAGRIACSIVACLSFALSVRCVEGRNATESDIETLVKALTSEDAGTTREAQKKLEAMGAEIVPTLFEKLLRADWELKPRLLEVLSAHGRDFAKQKLLNGNDTEKIYAALVYELSVSCAAEDFDYDNG